MELHEQSIVELGRLLRSGTVTSTDLTKAALRRIDTFDPDIRAFITLTPSRAMADAARSDSELAAGVDRGPLHGIPYALKDIYDTKGIATTCHSRVRGDHVPDSDSAVEARLQQAGGVLLGKLATFEFATGGLSHDLPWPAARNPWNTDFVTGGSSSGSAAAVAAGFTRLAFGSDTGGSIRGPSFNCGLVGLKPTYGRVSRRGVFPLSYSLDHAGPMGWTVSDVACGLQAVAGFDPDDPGSADTEVPAFSANLNAGVKGLRIGYLRHFMLKGSTSPEVLAMMDGVAQTFAAQGASVDEIRLPPFADFDAVARLIIGAESFAIHAEWLRMRPQDYGRLSYQRLLSGLAVSGSDLVNAHKHRRRLTHAVNDALRDHPIILAASSLAPPTRINPETIDIASVTTFQMSTFNVTGHPALAVPAGFASNGLPIGFQLAGRLFDEATVLQAGAAYEAAMPARSHPRLAHAR